MTVPSTPTAPPLAQTPTSSPDANGAASRPLVQSLPWDFKTTFPQPTPEAVEAGVVSQEDTEPENIAALHDEHAREALNILHDLDAVLDARRHRVDPATGKAPRTHAAKERLRKVWESEPDRLQRWWQTMMETYESVFGSDAADAFDKAIRAWHVGIEVIAAGSRAAPVPSTATIQEPPTHDAAETTLPGMPKTVRPKRARAVARLPVPRPLPSAVAAGHFGQDEHGHPIRPGAQEVREITVNHAEKLIDLLDSLPSAPANGKDALLVTFAAGIAAYADDFGVRAAEQLEAYVRREAGLDSVDRRGR